MKNFWENNLPSGYYDLIVRQGIENNRGIQTCWHVLTYSKVCSFVEENMDHLDYACGPGTLIGRYTKTPMKTTFFVVSVFGISDSMIGHL